MSQVNINTGFQSPAPRGAASYGLLREKTTQAKPQGSQDPRFNRTVERYGRRAVFLLGQGRLDDAFLEYEDVIKYKIPFSNEDFCKYFFTPLMARLRSLSSTPQTTESEKSEVLELVRELFEKTANFQDFNVVKMRKVFPFLEGTYKGLYRQTRYSEAKELAEFLRDHLNYPEANSSIIEFLRRIEEKMSSLEENKASSVILNLKNSVTYIPLNPHKAD